jgi:hypothetical protein
MRPEDVAGSPPSKGFTARPAISSSIRFARRPGADHPRPCRSRPCLATGHVLATPRRSTSWRSAMAKASPARPSQRILAKRSTSRMSRCVSIRQATCSARHRSRSRRAAAHRRLGRLQAEPRPDLRRLRAYPLRCLHHRGDIRPAGVPPSRRAATRSRRLLKSLARNPDRAHLVGVYSLGKAQRVIRLIRDAGYTRPLYIHGALQKLCDYYQGQGVDLGELLPATVAAGRQGEFAGAS